MKRGTTKEKTKLLQEFRERVPGMAIRTTLIVVIQVKHKKILKFYVIGCKK